VGFDLIAGLSCELSAPELVFSDKDDLTMQKYFEYLFLRY
jgi:hypothetical protein